MIYFYLKICINAYDLALGGFGRMKLRSNLSTLMGSKRYSMQDVHEKTGLSRGTISSLYNDRASRIDFETITRLCELFDCDIGTLLIFDKKDLKNDINSEDKNELYG